MDLSPFVESLRRDLGAAADAAGVDVRPATDRLLYALDPSVRLVLLDALGAAAAEVGLQLPDAAVEVRLRGRDPELVVLATEPGPGSSGRAPVPPVPPVPPSPPDPTAVPDPPGDGTEAGTARLTLRLPETLKARAEAAADQAGQSVNAWLVRAVTAALDQPSGWPDPPSRPGRPGRRMTGWAR